MSSIDEMYLLDARKEYLKSIKDPDLESGFLLEIIEKSVKLTPCLIVDYEESALVLGIDNDSSNWDASYLSIQITNTLYNFSLKRIKHLLDVRNKLAQDEIKGFVSLKEKKKVSVFRGGDMVDHFNVTDDFKRYISESDLLGVQISLRLDLNNNRLTKNNLISNIQYAKSKVTDLFVPYEEKDFAHEMSENKEEWSVKYYSDQMVFLKTNYAEERLMHLIDVREYLREKGVDGFVALPPKAKTSSSSTSQSSQSKSSSDTNNIPEGMDPVFKTALKIGGAVAALALILIALLR